MGPPGVKNRAVLRLGAGSGPVPAATNQRRPLNDSHSLAVSAAGLGAWGKLFLCRGLNLGFPPTPIGLPLTPPTPAPTQTHVGSLCLLRSGHVLLGTPLT